MIRLIFDSNFWGGTSAVQNIIESDEAISLYPNPTAGVIHIQSSSTNKTYNVRVMNSLGQEVKSFVGVNNSIDINELMNGIYIIAVSNSQTGKTLFSKVVKTGM